MKQLFIFLPAFFFASVIWASIYEIQNIADVMHYVSQNTNLKNKFSLLVVFDIDDTLIKQNMPEVNVKAFYKRVAELEQQGLTNEQACQLTEHEHIEIQKLAPIFPVENNTVEIFSELQRQEISLLGLTARSPKLIAHTHSKLCALGIDFTHKSFWPQEPYCFENFDRIPHYEPGIIFTNSNNKGTVLQLFLEKIGYIPDTIIFIDDVLRNLKNVEEMAYRLKINYIGLHYRRTRAKYTISPDSKMQTCILGDTKKLVFNAELAR